MLPFREPVTGPSDRPVMLGGKRPVPDPEGFPPAVGGGPHVFCAHTDRKSTRLNSSHLVISYAVFCLKKKKRITPSTLCGMNLPIHEGKLPNVVDGRILGHGGIGVINQGGANIAFFFFNDTATTEIYTLSLHDALPI